MFDVIEELGLLNLEGWQNLRTKVNINRKSITKGSNPRTQNNPLKRKDEAEHSDKQHNTKRDNQVG